MFHFDGLVGSTLTGGKVHGELHPVKIRQRFCFPDPIHRDPVQSVGDIDLVMGVGLDRIEKGGAFHFNDRVKQAFLAAEIVIVRVKWIAERAAFSVVRLSRRRLRPWANSDRCHRF